LNTGQFQEARSTFEELVEHSEKFGFEWVGAMSQAMKGTALIAQGDLKRGMSLYENANRVFLESKGLWRYVLGNYLIGMVYSKMVRGGGEKRNLSFFTRNIGFLIKTVFIARKKAKEHLHLAINTAKGIGAKSILGQAYLELGKLHKAKGKVEKARECISNAIEAFEKCEADVFLKQAKEAMETLI
jgi:tetratricopeptide (TPR) repeat protein